MVGASWRTHGGAVLLYMVFALCMSWPLLTTLTTHFAGNGGDPWQTLWRFESKLTGLQTAWSHQGADGAFGDFLATEFFGGGEPRLVNLSVWPWMVLYAVFGLPLAYNLIWLLSFVLSGYFMYLLARWVLADYRVGTFLGGTAFFSSSSFRYDIPAFLAGLFYMFLPYHVAQAHGHFGALQVQWLPLIVLLLLRFLRRPTIWVTLLLALGIVVQAWSEHHYLLWFALFALLLGFFEWRSVRLLWYSNSSRALSVVLVALLFLFVVVPYVPTLRLGLGSGGSLDLGHEQVLRFSADIFAYVLPPYFHPVWGGLSHAVFGQRFSGNEVEATQYLGLSIVLLVLFFRHRLPSRLALFWGVVGFVFFVISLGPRLHVLGLVTSLPLPYALLEHVPIFGVVRAVGRAGSMVGLSLAVLLAAVLATHMRRWSSVFVVTGMIVLEFLFIPFPLTRAGLPLVYREVAELPGASVIELPAATNYVAASRALLGTLVHGKEVVGSIALERGADPSELVLVRSLPAVRQLLFLRVEDLLAVRDDFFAQRFEETFFDVVEWLDVSAVVVHPDSLSSRQLAGVQHVLEDQLLLTPRLVDDTLLYDVRDGLMASDSGAAHGDGVFLMRDGTWRSVGFDADLGVTVAVFDQPSIVTLVNVTSDPLDARLSFLVRDGSVPFDLVRDGMVYASVVPLGERQTITVTLDPGSTVVTFTPQEQGSAVLVDPVLRGFPFADN